MDRDLQYAGDYSMACLGGTFLPERRFKRPVTLFTPPSSWYAPTGKPAVTPTEEAKTATDTRAELNN